MSRTVIIGRSGQVASALQHLRPDALVLGRDACDLSDPPAAAAALARVIGGASAVINAAAWTAVDRAEAEEPAATTVNATSPGALALVAADAGVPFLHISTDYVFDGGGSAAFTPDNPTGPLSAYGRSKLAGEIAVRAARGPHVILRTSWVFSAHGANFVKTMLRLGAGRPTLSVVADQTGGPTPALAIAGALLTIADAFAAGQGHSDTFHLSGAPDVTWADFARAIMTQARLPATVTDIATSAYPTPARRPANSRLDCASLRLAYGIARPDWRAGLRDVLDQLT